jgi:hypothetical protein
MAFRPAGSISAVHRLRSRRRSAERSGGRRGQRHPSIEGVLYRERRHPLWFFIRCWAWLLLLGGALPTAVMARDRPVQIVAGLLVVLAELVILARLIDWITTYIVITRTELQVVGYDGPVTQLNLLTTEPRIVQGAIGRRLGYAHVAARVRGIKIRASNQLFLSRPDRLRTAFQSVRQT